MNNPSVVICLSLWFFLKDSLCSHQDGSDEGQGASGVGGWNSG